MTSQITKEEMISIVSFIKNKLNSYGNDYCLTNSDIDEFKMKYPDIYVKLRNKFNNVLKKLDKIRKQYVRFKGGNTTITLEPTSQWKKKNPTQQEAFNILSSLVQPGINTAKDLGKGVLDSATEAATQAATEAVTGATQALARKFLENIGAHRENYNEAKKITDALFDTNEQPPQTSTQTLTRNLLENIGVHQEKGSDASDDTEVYEELKKNCVYHHFEDHQENLRLKRKRNKL